MGSRGCRRGDARRTGSDDQDLRIHAHFVFRAHRVSTTMPEWQSN